MLSWQSVNTPCATLVQLNRTKIFSKSCLCLNLGTVIHFLYGCTNDPDFPNLTFPPKNFICHFCKFNTCKMISTRPGWKYLKWAKLSLKVRENVLLTVAFWKNSWLFHESDCGCRILQRQNPCTDAVIKSKALNYTEGNKGGKQCSVCVLPPYSDPRNGTTWI
jgi:hypothetical protein